MPAKNTVIERIACAVGAQLGWEQEPVVTFSKKGIEFACKDSQKARVLQYSFLNERCAATLQENTVIISNPPVDVMKNIFQLSALEQADFYVQNKLTVPVQCTINALVFIGKNLTRQSSKGEFETAKEAGKALLNEVKGSLATSKQKKEFIKSFKEMSAESDKSKSQLNSLEYFKARTTGIHLLGTDIDLSEKAGSYVSVIENYTATNTNATGNSSSLASDSLNINDDLQDVFL